MRAEDVNPEWVKAAWRGWEGTQHDEASSDDIMAAAVAAVAPLIAAAERERCARVLDARVMGDCNREDEEAKRCAAAIRALGDADG